MALRLRRSPIPSRLFLFSFVLLGATTLGKKLLDQARSTPTTTPLENDGGHQVLIIGYNPDTKEFAWTDPWGKDTKERWMTQEEAVRCTLGQYYIITW